MSKGRNDYCDRCEEFNEVLDCVCCRCCWHVVEKRKATDAELAAVSDKLLAAANELRRVLGR